ncbi:MAG: Gfo/Idh/MocA family protein [Christensenellales bacterium]|jgi:predicted dehydrogenase
MLKFAIIGFGGLGRSHFRNMIHLSKETGGISLTAICDVDESRFTQQISTNLGANQVPLDLSAYNLYSDVDDLLANEDLDFVITALPTYLHAEIAIKALEKGIHVFSEKPMARTPEECVAMITAAEKNGCMLMIGHCLRYFPQYVKLKEYIDSKAFGDVIRAEFFRYSATPLWSWENWLMDFEKSGGAALDMHIHDVDFVQWVFGLPKAVTSFATHRVSKFDSIFTTYHYDDKLVSSACDWGLVSSFSFRPEFLVRFENAVVDFIAGTLKVYPHEGKAYDVQLDNVNGYVAEVQDFISCIKANQMSKKNPPRSALDSVRLVFAEMSSAEKGEKVIV